MFSVRFDTRPAEQFAKNTKKVDIDVQKAVNWYINQVYRELSKQHGRRYTYITPPGSKRLNVYKRTGKLLSELRDSKYVISRRSTGTWEAGFRIRKGSYLYKFHVGEPGEKETFRSGDVPSNQRFGGKVLIPLRAGLNANGTIKPIQARMNLRMRQFQFMRKQDFVGEDLSKFHEHSLIIYKIVGRKRVPMYVLVKKFTVPKRIHINEKMLKYYDDLFDRIDHMIEVELNKAYR